MTVANSQKFLDTWKKIYPEKFATENEIFSRIRRGQHIFVTSGCGEPQYLIAAMTKYVESHPKAFFDAEIIQIYSLGIAPYTDEKFRSNFRHNSFFIGNNTRDPVNKGAADYTPISLSDIPALITAGMVQIDIALIQTSLPDEHGFLSLGVSVDVVKTAAERASLVIAQVNSYMPRANGDGFINIKDVNFIIPHDAQILEIQRSFSEEKTISLERIGFYVSRLIQDGDTLQVGYGSIPNAIMAHLYNKKNLGIHTELLTEGIISLSQAGVIDNSKKTLNRGKTVATFCMAKKETYDYIHDNPSIVFRTVDYTNNPMVIARNDNMVAINSALEIDLTGQATSESIGSMFYSGIGGFHDFMRGALLAKNGKTILAMKSTAADDSISRIVPTLSPQAGVTLSRADVRYVVTEHGIAYLHGKNIRERAMSLISIAHPKFRPWLIEEAKKRGLIYQDQAYIPGERGRYPEALETFRATKTGLQIFLRSVKITDEPLLKDFFYSLSDRSLHRRFMSWRTDIPHERLQDFVIIDYTKEISILAIIGSKENEIIVGLGQYGIDEATHTAEVAVAVRDDYQKRGVGTELLSYLTYLAKREGLLGFTAEVLVENTAMLQVFEKGGFDITKQVEAGVYHLKMAFRIPESVREI